MKKLTLLLIIVFLVSGCDDNQLHNAANYNVDTALFKVKEPYQEGINGNYINNKLASSFDIKAIDRNLMYITKSYFNTNDNYVTEGQYLNRDIISHLLSDEVLNKNIKLDEYLYQEPLEVIYLHEQNYVNDKDVLQGIAISVVIKNDIDETDPALLNDIKKQLTTRLKLMIPILRDNEKLQDLPIIIAVYFSNNTSNYKGDYLFETRTINNTVTDLKSVNNRSYNLLSNALKNKNQSLYDNFKEFNKTLRTIDDNIFISGEVIFNGSNIVKIDIKVTVIFPTYYKTAALSNLIADSINQYLDYDADIKVSVVSASELISTIYQNEQTKQITITLLN